jgi:hypothetical protein
MVLTIVTRRPALLLRNGSKRRFLRIENQKSESGIKNQRKNKIKKGAGIIKTRIEFL